MFPGVPEHPTRTLEGVLSAGPGVHRGLRPRLTHSALEGSLGQKKIVGSLHNLSLGFHACQIGVGARGSAFLS